MSRSPISRQLLDHRESLERKASLFLSGDPGRAALAGTTLLTPVEARGLVISSIEDNTLRRQRDFFDFNFDARAVQVHRNPQVTLAYVAAYNDGLVIVDYRNPISPTLMVRNTTLSRAFDIAVGPMDNVYIAAENRLLKVNVANPYAPNLVAEYLGTAMSVTAADDGSVFLYAGGNGVVRKFDADLVTLDTLTYTISGFFLTGPIKAIGKHVYLPVAFSNFTPDLLLGFEVIASNNTHITNKVAYRTNVIGYPRAIEVAGSHVFIGGTNTIKTVDMSDLNNIRMAGEISTLGTPKDLISQDLSLLAVLSSPASIAFFDKNRIEAQDLGTFSRPSEYLSKSIQQGKNIRSVAGTIGTTNFVNIMIPRDTGTTDGEHSYRDILAIDQENLVLGITYGEVQLLNFADPRSPQILSSLVINSPVSGSLIGNSTALIMKDTGLQLINISNGNLHSIFDCATCPQNGNVKAVQANNLFFVLDQFFAIHTVAANLTALQWTSSINGFSYITDMILTAPQTLFATNFDGYSEGRYVSSLYRFSFNAEGVLVLEQSLNKFIRGQARSLGVRPGLEKSSILYVLSTQEGLYGYDILNEDRIALALKYPISNPDLTHLIITDTLGEGLQAVVTMGDQGIKILKNIAPNPDPYFVSPAPSIIIHQGQDLLVQLSDLDVFAPATADDDSKLLFKVSNVVGGYFYKTSNPSTAIYQFSRAQVGSKATAEQIRMRQSGNLGFGFKVTVNDGFGDSPLIPVQANVRYITIPPALELNPISVEPGKAVVIDLSHIRAITANQTDPNIIIHFPNQANGQIENADDAGVKINSCLQSDLFPPSKIRAIPADTKDLFTFDVYASIGTLQSNIVSGKVERALVLVKDSLKITMEKFGSYLLTKDATKEDIRAEGGKIQEGLLKLRISCDPATAKVTDTRSGEELAEFMQKDKFNNVMLHHLGGLNPICNVTANDGFVTTAPERLAFLMLPAALSVSSDSSNTLGFTIGGILVTTAVVLARTYLVKRVEVRLEAVLNEKRPADKKGAEFFNAITAPIVRKIFDKVTTTSWCRLWRSKADTVSYIDAIIKMIHALSNRLEENHHVKDEYLTRELKSPKGSIKPALEREKILVDSQLKKIDDPSELTEAQKDVIITTLAEKAVERLKFPTYSCCSKDYWCSWVSCAFWSTLIIPYATPELFSKEAQRIGQEAGNALADSKNKMLERIYKSGSPAAFRSLPSQAQLTDSQSGSNISLDRASSSEEKEPPSVELSIAV